MHGGMAVLKIDFALAQGFNFSSAQSKARLISFLYKIIVKRFFILRYDFFAACFHKRSPLSKKLRLIAINDIIYKGFVKAFLAASPGALLFRASRNARASG